MEQFNRLTPVEAERLAFLAEECGEIIHAIGKILRYGHNGTPMGAGKANREVLERECGDAHPAMERPCDHGEKGHHGTTVSAPR